LATSLISCIPGRLGSNLFEFGNAVTRSNRIRLTKKDSGEGSHKGHDHYIDRGLVAGFEGDKVRLSASGAVAITMEQERT
jgi:hypothetical protein